MMTSKRVCLLSLIFLATLTFSSQSSHAAGEAVPLPEKQWGFKGVFGTFDRAALQRGFKVYQNTCAACHGLDHKYYRNLSDLGYSENQIKAIASQYTVIDGPNDEGEMFERPGIPADRFVNPYKNEAQARYANNGAYPPDLSLITKARVGGANYVYWLLKGYEDPPKGKTLLSGQHWNKYMPGHVIAMAAPLSDGMIAYEDGTQETLSQYAQDVTEFLAWAAEPEMETRKRMGIRVILFLIVFAFIMYLVKRKIWSDIAH